MMSGPCFLSDLSASSSNQSGISRSKSLPASDVLDDLPASCHSIYPCSVCYRTIPCTATPRSTLDSPPSVYCAFCDQCSVPREPDNSSSWEFSRLIKQTPATSLTTKTCSSSERHGPLVSQWQSSVAAVTSVDEGVNSRRNNRNGMPRWDKILWRKQPFEDNYVDETFLDSLITNANLRTYTYWGLCASTVSITQHLSLVGIFIVAWRLIKQKQLPYQYLIMFDLAILPLGFSLRRMLRQSIDVIRYAIPSAMVVFGCLWILSPILLTLTKTFSDDTVFTLTTLFLLLHVALHDYPYVYRNPHRVDERVTSSMALNAAMFAAVLLASRLDTGTEVFAFLFFGIEVFALSPMVRRYILQRSNRVYTLVLTPVIFVVTATLLRLIAGIVVHLYILCTFFITLVGPMWFIRSQKYKNEIRGPWDIAHVRSHP
eukprot:GHVQ01013643.1.p1 GENE.GHVQ01013643.1~~GHVQ01013643.1.p1  ORF type:complete len:429 (+),score=21.58 GHVQ01013643.1:248-1534(+)